MKTFDEAFNSISLARADAIVQFLGEKGIKGVRCNSTCCPLAEYMKKETGLYCIVGTSNVFGWNEDIDPPYTFKNRLTNTMAQFIRSFDAGAFPELEEEL